MVLLCILDGFGLREATPDNAIAAADKPVYNSLRKHWPMTKLDGSGRAVGLPEGQMGNSEVGHLNLGAGRVVYQDITRINKAIADGSFEANKVLNDAMEQTVSGGGAVHLIGLVSGGGVHSSMGHLFALVRLARSRGVANLYLHAFMDGRDTPPESGRTYMSQVLKQFNDIGIGKVATVVGRYYGMDRDKRWERTDKAFRAIVHGEGEQHTDPIAAIESSYAAGVTDEFIVPRVIANPGSPAGRLRNGDTAIMFNFRADRMRQLAQVVLGEKIDGYEFSGQPEVKLVTMTQYDSRMKNARIAFEPMRHKNILGEVLSRSGKKQLRTAETEKYAHVTFFFNGGVEKPFDGEQRDLIPSPKVATYDLKPEMSSVEVTDNVVGRIESGEFDFVLLNYANCDMVGHTGDFDAARKAVEAVDKGLGRVLAAVEKQSGVAIVTADHGNAEMMIDPATGGPWTAHTTNLVPCIIFDPGHRLGQVQDVRLRSGGILADLAPTILEIMRLPIPKEMSGTSLLTRG